jgi:hypothetical protein
MSETHRYRVIRWRRIVEDAVVDAASRDEAFDTADSNDSWQIIDEQTVDTECEELH